MSSSRRSIRLKSINESNSSSSQPVSADSEITDTRYKDVSSNETSDEDEPEESEESSDEDNEDSADEDYVASTKKRKGATRAAATKKRKTGSTVPRPANARKPRPVKQTTNFAEKMKIEENFKNLLENFTPTSLFTSMCTEENNISISELVHEWLELYVDSPQKAKQTFVNFILNCSGSLIQVEEHDVANSDTANETVSEVQLLFNEQKFHEFYLLNSHTHKNQHKQYKYLYDNFIEFMDLLVRISYEKGLLCVAVEDDSSNNENQELNSVHIAMGPMILDLIIWLSSLSVSSFRCFRYTSTLALYVFESALVQLIPSIDKESIQNLKTLIERENKKKRPNNKAIEQWKSQLEEEQEHKNTIESIISEIFKVSFVHRFRDIDETIRAYSIKYLANWFTAWPEHFFQVTYLKYFGWLLTDQNVSVKNQVLLALVDLIKCSSSKNFLSLENDSLRQFFERFQDKIKQIACFDSNFECKKNAVKVLIEINQLEYLEPSERLTISSLLFDINLENIKVAASTSKEARFFNSVAKLFNDSESSIELLFKGNASNKKNKSKKNKDALQEEFAPVVKFVQFLIDSLTCHVTIAKKLATYDNYDTDDVEVRFNTFTDYAKEIHLVSQFLSSHYKQLIPVFCKMLTFQGNFGDVFNTDSSKVIVPDTVAHSELYTVILSGLCQGFAGNGKSISIMQQLKDMVMPFLPSLICDIDYASVSMRSEYTFQIMEQFSYEHFDESSLQKITAHIQKMYMNIEVPYETLEENFQSVFQFYKKNIGSSLHDHVWKSSIQELLSSIKTFLKNGFTDKELSFSNKLQHLMDTYMYKLVVLGKFYEVQFDKELTDLFISNVFEPLMDEIDELDCKHLDFKIFPLFISWSLLKTEELSSVSNESVEEEDINEVSEKIPTESFNQIYMFVQYLLKLENRFFALVGNENLNILLYKLGTTIIDILISLKAFVLAHESEKWMSLLESKFDLEINSDELNSVFQGIFCYLETKAACEMGIAKLERNIDEDSSLNGLLKNKSIEKDENNLDDFNKLCIFTIKVKTLIKLQVLDNEEKSTDTLLQRMLLNRNLLGPVFSNIVEDKIESSNQVSSTRPQIIENTQQRQISEQEFANDPIEVSESLGF